MTDTTGTTDTTQKPGFVANEPVIFGSLIAWLLSVAGTFVLGHTHLITGDQWSTLSTILVPLVTGLVLAVVAKLTRNVVTPAWKSVASVANRAGLSDAVLQEVVRQAVRNELATLNKGTDPVSKDVQAIESHQGDPGVQQAVEDAEVVEIPEPQSA